MSKTGNKRNSCACACDCTGGSGPAVILILCVAAMSATVGCARPVAKSGGFSPSSIEESVLYGGSPCSGDEDCPGGVCAGAECAGFLVIPSDIARDQAGERLKTAIAGKEPVSRRLAEAAARVVLDPAAETFGRSRAADIFRFLPCELAGEALLPALEVNLEAVRFYASRSLALCGYEAGVRNLEAFGQHSSEPVRLMSRAALETLEKK